MISKDLYYTCNESKNFQRTAAAVLACHQCCKYNRAVDVVLSLHETNLALAPITITLLVASNGEFQHSDIKKKRSLPFRAVFNKFYRGKPRLYHKF